MTFEEVKKAFFRYDGSLFAMAREEKEAYESYKLLNIPEEMAEAWKQELFFSLWEQLKESGSSELFNRMCNLSENRHSRENLLILKGQNQCFALHSLFFICITLMNQDQSFASAMILFNCLRSFAVNVFLSSNSEQYISKLSSSQNSTSSRIIWVRYVCLSIRMR